MKKSLTVINPQTIVVGLRQPTFTERLLFGITCIGFCDGNVPEQIEHCKQVCGTELLKRLGRYTMHASPKRLDSDNSIVIIQKSGEDNG